MRICALLWLVVLVAWGCGDNGISNDELTPTQYVEFRRLADAYSFSPGFTEAVKFVMDSGLVTERELVALQDTAKTVDLIVATNVKWADVCVTINGDNRAIILVDSSTTVPDLADLQRQHHESIESELQARLTELRRDRVAYSGHVEQPLVQPVDLSVVPTSDITEEYFKRLKTPSYDRSEPRSCLSGP